MRVFISYSSKDKSFAKRLHESLVLAGIDTFFDEKDIKVGDNIPIMIEKGITESSALVYVISSHSIDSSWVQTELSMAKIKANADRGFKILPVLIEDIQLPIGISHVRYADFVEWKLSEKFYKSLSDLLDGVGTKKQIPEIDSITFAIDNYNLLQSIESVVLRAYSIIDGLIDGFHSVLPMHALASPSPEVLWNQADGILSKLGLSILFADLKTKLEALAPGKFQHMLDALIICENDLDSLHMHNSVKYYETLDNLLKIKQNLKLLADNLAPILQNARMQLLALVQSNSVEK